MQFHRLLAAPLTAALLLATSNAFAQPTVPAAPMKAPAQATAPKFKAPLDAANWRAIRIKNVRPSMIAYQLDNAHNGMPAFFNVPYAPPPKYAANYKEPERVEGPFDLPANVQLAASDEQNLLFVAGANDAQIAQIQELVALLDQPLRSVEIEAQLVGLTVAEANNFGIDWPEARGNADAATAGQPKPGALQFGVVRGDFQARIDDLLKDNKARVISTQPLILNNNSSQAVSLRFGPIDNTGAHQNKPLVAPKAGSDTILTLTPTINGGDTISVRMNVTTLPATDESLGLMSIFNLRDGQTIALTGLKASAFPRATTAPVRPIPMLGDIPLIGNLFGSKNPEDESAILLLVTARVVRDDEK